VDWSEATFKEAAGHFKSINPETRTYIIPISASNGDNLFELADYLWIRDGSVTPVLRAIG
jgi:sulfate adenylyltransferase subunit 1 (EFTu-like GTPase family)